MKKWPQLILLKVAKVATGRIGFSIPKYIKINHNMLNIL